MNKHFCFLLSVFLLIIYSCKKENGCDCLKGAGKDSVKELVLQPFKFLRVDKNLIVEIKTDTFFKMKVLAGNNLIPLVHAGYAGDTLVLSNDNKCNWMRSYDKKVNVVITVPYLEEIKQTGIGKIFSTDTLRGSDLTLDIKNSGDIDLRVNVSNLHCNIHAIDGDITVKGFAGVNYVYNHGEGFIYAGELQTDITFLGSYDVGTCYVRAKDRLEVTIDYTGSVYYSGDPPVIKKSITGSGKLIHQD